MNRDDKIVSEILNEYTMDVREVASYYKRGDRSIDEVQYELFHLYLDYEEMILTQPQYKNVIFRIVLSLNAITRTVIALL